MAIRVKLDHLLLDRNLFLTRFGSSDPNNRVLRRLHALVSAEDQWLADNGIEWLEDLVHWLFERGRAPGAREGERELDTRTRLLITAAEEVPSFAEKLRGFAEGMFERLSHLNPRTPRELQRFAPQLHQQLVEIRQRNIPYVFGRFIEEGQIAGKVRTDINAAFAVEFFLQAMQGLMQSGVLDRHRIAPQDLVPRAIDLFFGGLLTPAGRKEHEKLFAH